MSESFKMFRSNKSCAGGEKQNEETSFLSESELKTIGFLKYGTNVLVSRKASIYNPEQIVLGDNIRIDDFVY